MNPDEQFWRTRGHNFLRPKQHGGGDEFPGGFDLLGLLRRKLADCNTVLEIGCGDGRLSGAFCKHRYTGVDINPTCIQMARDKHPGYTFRLVHYLDYYPMHFAVLLHTVLLHIPDDLINEFVGRACRAAWDRVLVSEILGREWRRKSGMPPVYNRELDEYVELFRHHGFVLSKHTRVPYKHYLKYKGRRNTDMSFLQFNRGI